MKKGNKAVHKTSIGGQALYEGIMMRGVDKAAMAVRIPEGTIDVEIDPVTNRNKSKVFKIPIVRGVFSMVESFTMGYKYLSRSMEKAEPELANEEDGSRTMGVATVVGTVLGLIIAVALFLFLPAYLVSLLGQLVQTGVVRTILEGLIKILIFVGYLTAVSFLPDMKRMFAYHGAEHKTIACYEAGDELIPENVEKHIRFHPRCGTSFLIIILIISIVISSFLTWDNLVIRVLLKVLSLPLVIGIGYELIKLAGRYDNLFTRIVSAPGLAMQRITTKEPDRSQIEVAIAAMKAVVPDSKEDDRW